jgi:hypothetical protein
MTRACRSPLAPVAVVVTVLGLALPAAAAPTDTPVSPAVRIVLGPEAPPGERDAAAELERALVRLFRAAVTVAETPGDDAPAPPRILLGRPETNPEVRTALGSSWPADLGEQGHLVRSTPRGLVLGGGSPAATRWAVQEFARLHGVRSLGSGDFFPVAPPTLTLDGHDRVWRPVAPVRAWRVATDGPASQAAWPTAACDAFCAQLAKLKFNALLLPDGTASPAFAPIPVAGDVAGRSVFGGAKEFLNPDLTPAGTAERWLAGWRDSARRHGLEVLPPDHPAARIDPSLRAPGLFPPGFAVATGTTPWLGPDGFALSGRFVADLDPTLHFLSRAAWDASLTPEAAWEDLLGPVCGEGVAGPFSRGLAWLAEASAGVEGAPPAELAALVPGGTAFPGAAASPSPTPGPVPAWMIQAKDRYGKAMGEFYRANTRARDGARPLLLRQAKRATYAVHLLSAAEAAHAASTAQDAAAREEASASAVEAMHNALAIWAEVAAEPGDAGGIARMNEAAYRPLLEALDAAAACGSVLP